jgi:uncharacterized membrane protein HdeD (DUF308 family)
MTENAMTFETEQHPWWLTLMGGILSFVIGLLLLTSPAKTVFTLVVGLGIYWIISGIFHLAGMFLDHHAWGWKLFAGLLEILAGFLILRYPLIATIEVPQVIVFLVALQSVVVGIILLVMAFQGGGWGIGILGVLGVVFGGILLVNYWRLASIAGLVWVVGIFALVVGFVQILHAFQRMMK